MMQPLTPQDKNKSQTTKQKIVLHVPVNEEKSRAKAMTIASKIKGVTNVSISKERNQMVVIGEEVDSVDLANSLRKRFQFADILSVKSVYESGLSKHDFDKQTRYHRPTQEYPNQYSDSIAIRPLNL